MTWNPFTKRPDSEALRFVMAVMAEGEPEVETRESYIGLAYRTTLKFPKVTIILEWNLLRQAFNWWVVSSDDPELELYASSDSVEQDDVLLFLRMRGFDKGIDRLIDEGQVRDQEKRRRIESLKREYLTKGDTH